MNAGKPPLTYKQFQRIIEGMEPPAKPVPTLTLQVMMMIMMMMEPPAKPVPTLTLQVGIALANIFNSDCRNILGCNRTYKSSRIILLGKSESSRKEPKMRWYS